MKRYMKRFDDYLKEDLNTVGIEPISNASKQASQLGLSYVGFGRYEDPKTQQITHIVQDDKLVPYKRAMKTNTFKQQSSNDLADMSSNLAPALDQMHTGLTKHYSNANFTEDELTTLQNYTQGAFFTINNRLWQLPAGVPVEGIQPAYDGDPIPRYVAALDSAMAKSAVPANLTTYAAFNNDMDPSSIQPGTTITFKGYRSTTLDPSVAVDQSGETQPAGVFDLRRKSYVLQIKIATGSTGIYVDDYSATPGEKEFLLPRGSQIQITDGPKKLIAGNASIGRDDEIVYFDCQLIKASK